MNDKNEGLSGKTSTDLFQSYRWTNDPIVVKLDESKVPKHIKDKLEDMKSKYLNQNFKASKKF
jgi:hypothetical protein